jgi:hypothetical protein
MIKLYDYETSIQTRTFDTYNDVDCFNYSDVHDYIKYIKHGYGKVSDHVSREIRLRHMTLEKGIELINKYTLIKPKNLQLFLNWIGITENSFNYLIDQYRNKKLWQRNENWEWELKSELNYANLLDAALEDAKLPQINFFESFILTPTKKSSDKKNQYILIGKGY